MKPAYVIRAGDWFLQAIDGPVWKAIWSTLPGWFCAHCGVFNGAAKELRAECRSCGAARTEATMPAVCASYGGFLGAFAVCGRCGQSRQAHAKTDP